MNTIAKALLWASFILLPACVYAQEMKVLPNPGELESRLAHEAQTLQSIESDFTQVKYVDVFAEKVTSKGKFYYQRSNKIRMEYFRPMDYLIVINGSQLKIVSDGKTNIMGLSSNQLMNQMQDMFTACMVGDLSRMSAGYRLTYFEDNRYYLVKIKPLNKAVLAYIAGMEIYIDKKDMSVYKLRLNETGTDYTEYEFYNKRFNSLKDGEKFAIR
ncbi:MAG: outer membrane lipoprotein carrier protein LolA [Mediterranea sp.]|jgi:outer membrane lipoprotein-sorting protein|nr:outer membrane lipoprotein carrier protein LolA [Mediterranea sp.]